MIEPRSPKHNPSQYAALSTFCPRVLVLAIHTQKSNNNRKDKNGTHQFLAIFLLASNIKDLKSQASDWINKYCWDELEFL